MKQPGPLPIQYRVSDEINGIAGQEPWFEWRGANLYPIHRNGWRLFGVAIVATVAFAISPLIVLLMPPLRGFVQPAASIALLGGIGAVAITLLIARTKT